MSRSILHKRLGEAESKLQKGRAIRARTEARSVTPELLEQMFAELDAEYRAGRDGSLYHEKLSTGELLRLLDEHDAYVKRQASLLTPEHFEKLDAEGIGVDRWTEAELYAVVGDDGIDWTRLPDGILDAIQEDPAMIDWEDLKNRYPKR